MQEVGRKPLPAFSALTYRDGGNAARLQGVVAEGLGEIFLNKSPSIPLFQRGKKFPAPPYFKFPGSPFSKGEVIRSDILPTLYSCTG
jgi:hypothetical protein